ncbi:hypothetical protein FRB94_002002 [Tulasnella sp. JGI-2019a]|nr:hypothetical protein FRB94_002002 [Tulasnella sp. JGI-2019a]
MEKYSGMTAVELYTPVMKGPRDGDGPGMWRLSPFWVLAAGTLGPSARKAVAICILEMELNGAQITSILGQCQFVGFERDLGDKWRVMLMAAKREDRLAAFRALPQRSNDGPGPQQSIIDGIIGWYKPAIGQYIFTEDQVTELREVLFLHSKPERLQELLRFDPPAAKYLDALRTRFIQLTWEHKVDIRLLTLLTKSPARWNGLRKDIAEGNLTFFMTSPTDLSYLETLPTYNPN